VFDWKGPSVAIDHFSGETLYFWIGPGQKEIIFWASGSRYTLIKNTGYPRRVKIMSKTKSKSKKKVGAAKKAKADVNEIPVDGEALDEMSAGEKFLMASKPYWAHILLGVLAVIFASVLWTAWGNMQRESQSEQWRELNNAVTQAGITQDVSSLKEMAGNYEGEAAANWALQFAGDNEINRGISMLAGNRISGLKLIEEGAKSLQKVVDSPGVSKSPMLQRRSLFMLGYANEAMGKFDDAKANYETLLELAPESPFTDVTRRGLARVTNPELVAVYDKFRNWEEATTDVSGGGDFGGGEMKKEEAMKPADGEKKEMSEEKVDPSADMEKATEKMEKATEKVEMPTEKVDLPTEKIESPVEKVEMPAEKVDMPAVQTGEPAVEPVKGEGGL